MFCLVSPHVFERFKSYKIYINKKKSHRKILCIMSYLTKSDTEGFDFVHIDIAKFYTVIRTHQFYANNELSSTTNYNTDVYSRFIDFLTNLCDSYNCSTFSKAEINCELVECFTAQVLYEYGAFSKEDLTSYYLPALEIFEDTDRKLGFDLYVTMCHQMDWTQYSVHLMSRIADLNLLISKCGPFQNTNNTTNYLIFNFFKQLSHYVCYVNSDSKFASFPNEIQPNSSDPQSQLMTQMNLVHREVLNIYDFVYTNNNYDDVEDVNLDSYRSKFTDSCEKFRKMVLDTKSILTQHFSSITWDDSLYNYASDVQDALLFLISTLKFVNARLNCRFFDQIQLSDFICLEYFEKRFSFVHKLYFIIRNGRPQLASFFYLIMLHNLDHFQDCSIFDGIKRGICDVNKIKHEVFWKDLLHPDKIKLLAKEYFFIFEITSISNTNCFQEQLFELSFNLLLKNRVGDVAFVNQLLQRRLQLCKLTPFNLFRKNLPNNFIECCNKSRLDLRNEQIKEIVFETLKYAFCTPLATLKSILYRVLVHRPATCQSIAYLLVNQLHPVLNYCTSTIDVLTGIPLGLLSALLVSKLRHNSDFISIESLFDLLTCITKLNPTYVNVEQLFVNLIACAVDRHSLHFHQTLHQLLEFDKQTKWSGANFGLINSYLLIILSDCWQFQAKKEIISSISYQYQNKCEHIKLNQNEVARIACLLKTLNHETCVSPNVLLFYLNKCFSFPPSELVPNDYVAILSYAAIAADNSWLVAKHKTQSPDRNLAFFTHLYDCIIDGNNFLYFTQQEWQNLIDFASQFHPRRMLLLNGIAFTLLMKLHEYPLYTTEALIYFSRTTLSLLDIEFQKIKNCLSKDILLVAEYFYAWLSLAWIKIKFESNSELNYSLNEVSIEVKRLVESGNVEFERYHASKGPFLVSALIKLCDTFIESLRKVSIQHSVDLKQDLFNNCSDSIHQAFDLHCITCVHCRESSICKTD